MSQIITFYSYKGGVGRSMALANVATLLSMWGKKVLMIDWDLEAPGLENFFKDDYLKDIDWSKQRGVLDFLYAKRDNKIAKWQDWVIPFRTEQSKSDLHLLVSGRANEEYTDMLRDFDVTKFYEKHDGGRVIDGFREELLNEYDYVLIDSRTGVTDFGGICTIQMPDILVMLFTPTEQGLSGTKKVAQRILESHQKLPFDRYRLLICPIPSRFDSTTEFQESRKWLGRSGKELGWLYEEWLSDNINLNEFLQILKIPYISYFSFGEKLPVIEQGVNDPVGLGYAYENLTMLLANALNDVDKFIEQRDTFLQEVSGLEISKNLSQEPNNAIRQVRIYISFLNSNIKVANSLIKAIKESYPFNAIEILTRPETSVGQSLRKSIAEKVLRSDIILLLIGNGYFRPSGSRTHLGESLLPHPYIEIEFQIIEAVDSEIIIPIFLDIEPSRIYTLPIFIRDRHGVVAKSIEIEKIIDEIRPIIEKKINEKDVSHVVV